MSPQTSIAHYKVVSKLGAGGMGEVWRARDTKLNRDVAIKVLPESYAVDHDRMVRFTREAQVLAGLNHPNIAAIYGVEDRALVLELVEGPTLGDRIEQGAVPMDEALPLIRQLIDAIDHAHQKGVIHRDLKPANIKVTPEGKLKVLDFGLAKALSGTSQSRDGEPANSPTMTLAMGSLAGVVLGTAAYMAPEQARGKTVDKRADIWAFGVVVYEMLTGRRLFEGESVSDILAQTLTKEIDLDPLPAQARPLLRRCLVRNPEARLRDIGDALDLLQPVVETAPQPRRQSRWMAAAIAGFLLALAFAVLWQRAASRHEPPFAVRLSLGDARLSSPVSPDGSAVILVTSDGILLRRIDELRPRHLPGTEGATWVFWAADSSAIGFFQQGKLCVLTLATQEVRRLANAPDPGGADWRGGDIVFVSAGKLMHFSLTSGAVRQIPVKIPDGEVALNPTFLPRNSNFVFASSPPDRDNRTLYRASLQGGAPVRLMETPYRVQFARHPRTGRWYIFYSPPDGPKLMTAPVDAATGERTGEPVQLLDGVGGNTAERRMAVDVSESGRITFRRNFAAAPVYRIRWHAPDGKVLASLGDKVASNDILLSPDESQVAALIGFPRKGVSLFDARSGNIRRLTSATENAGQGLAWTRDSRMVYYQIEQSDGTWGIVRHAADGSSRPELIGQSDFGMTLMDISSDGQYLVLGPSQTAGSAFFRLRTTGTTAKPARPERWITFGPNFRPRGAQARFTPDGKHLFMVGGAGEGHFIAWNPESSVEAVLSGSVTFPLSGPFFSADGRTLCGSDRERVAIICRSVTPVSGRPPALGPPTILFSSVMPQSSAYGNIGSMAKDGRILLLSTDEPEEVGMQFLSDWTLLLPGKD